MGLLDGPGVKKDSSRSVGERRGLVMGWVCVVGPKRSPRTLLGSGGGWWWVMGVGGQIRPLTLCWGVEAAGMGWCRGLGVELNPSRSVGEWRGLAGA